MCIETQINDSIPLVLESTNFLEAFESRLEWLSNQGATPQSPDRIGINHGEITELELLFPAILAHQVKHGDSEKDSEYLELWATPCNLYRDPHAPHYSLSWSLEHLVKGNSFESCTGLRLRRSYVFIDQDYNLNLLLNDNMFEFRTQAVLGNFMDKYNICRLFVNPDEHNISGGKFPMTCITQTEFWEARRKDELAAVAKQYGICDPSDLLGFVSFARGLMDSTNPTTLKQLAQIIEANKGGYL